MISATFGLSGREMMAAVLWEGACELGMLKTIVQNSWFADRGLKGLGRLWENLITLGPDADEYYAALEFPERPAAPSAYKGSFALLRMTGGRSVETSEGAVEQKLAVAFCSKDWGFDDVGADWGEILQT